MGKNRSLELIADENLAPRGHRLVFFAAYITLTDPIGAMAFSEAVVLFDADHGSSLLSLYRADSRNSSARCSFHNAACVCVP